MKRYIGVKEINAIPMSREAYNNLRGWQLPSDENGADEGYLVVYIDGGKPNHSSFAGYISWSPSDVFHKEYRPIYGMTFGLALEALKKGMKVQRDGWKGKGLWLELQVPDAHSKMTLPYIFMSYPDDAKTTSGARVPWLASQIDMLVEDWVILN